MKKRIIITGGTGLIGTYLTKEFPTDYEFIMLTRNPDQHKVNQSIAYVYWDGESAIPSILEGAYAIINLIGENIGAKAWTHVQKAKILKSRTNAALAIKTSIEECEHKPEVWIQASAAGFYGQGIKKTVDEFSPKGANSFLADVCQQWEQPIKDLNEPTVRKVIIRTGVVLAKDSDLWKQLTLPFCFKVAVTVGNGKQFLPWIHIKDEAKAIHTLLTNKNCEGIFNLVSPEETTMQQLVKEIKDNKRVIASVKIPAQLLSLVMGREKTKELVLTDQRVAPRRLLEFGFSFQYPSIKDAVASLL